MSHAPSTADARTTAAIAAGHVLARDDANGLGDSVASGGGESVWPRVAGRRVSGWISMRLAASRLAGAATITFQFAEHARTTVHVRPGRPQLLRVPLCAAKNARVTYRSKKVTLVGVRAVTVRATAPVFTPSPSACSALG